MPTTRDLYPYIAVQRATKGAARPSSSSVLVESSTETSLPVHLPQVVVQARAVVSSPVDSNQYVTSPVTSLYSSGSSVLPTSHSASSYASSSSVSRMPLIEQLRESLEQQSVVRCQIRRFGGGSGQFKLDSLTQTTQRQPSMRSADIVNKTFDDMLASANVPPIPIRRGQRHR